MNVAIITKVPAPYREPIFNYLSDKVNLKVIYLYMDKTRGWEVLQNPSYPFVFTKNPASHLKKNPLDLMLVYGYSDRNALLSLLYGFKNRIPVIMRTDSNIEDERYKPPVKRFLKKILLKKLSQKIAYFLTVGERNEKYWAYYGAQEENFVRARYTVEVEFFSKETERLRKITGEVLKKYSLPASRYILFVGRLVIHKGVDILINAFKEISKSERDANLLICGEGPEMKKLREMAGDLLNKRIFFTGKFPRKNLPEVFALSSILVLPSYFEQWGLIVNEAMAGGVVPIVSENCGCVPDLIAEGKTGWIFKRGDTADLTEKLKIALRTDLKPLSKRAQQKSNKITLYDNAMTFYSTFKKIVD